MCNEWIELTDVLKIICKWLQIISKSFGFRWFASTRNPMAFFRRELEICFCNVLVQRTLVFRISVKTFLLFITWFRIAKTNAFLIRKMQIQTVFCIHRCGEKLNEKALESKYIWIISAKYLMKFADENWFWIWNCLPISEHMSTESPNVRQLFPNFWTFTSIKLIDTFESIVWHLSCNEEFASNKFRILILFAK